MGWTYVGESLGSGSAATITVADDINVQAGDLIVAYIKWEDIAATVTWAGDSDEATNQLTVGDISAESNPYGCWAYRLSAAADATFRLKVNFSGAVDFIRIGVYVHRPDSGDTVSLDGTYNLLHGTSGDPQSSDLTAAGSDVVAFGAYGEYAAGVPTTFLIGDAAADGSMLIASLYAMWRKAYTGVPGTIHAQCSGGGDPWQCGIIAFKAVTPAEPVGSYALDAWLKDSFMVP